MPSFFENAMKHILVCTDGEPHTHRAEEQALELAARSGAAVTGLYVQSTFLKKFTHEIYAVGRNECRDHLDSALKTEGDAALEALGRRCAAAGVAYEARMRQGDVAEEILAESTAGYDLIVMGAKLLDNWRSRLESVNVPVEVFKRATLPMLFVR
jgi:nucleotide-binding universal stress UspA family protein